MLAAGARTTLGPIKLHRNVHSFSSGATMNQPIDFQVLPSPPMWMIFQILSNSNSSFDSIFTGLAVKNRTVRSLRLDYSSRPWVIDSIKMSILLLGSPIDDPGLCLKVMQSCLQEEVL